MTLLEAAYGELTTILRLQYIVLVYCAYDVLVYCACNTFLSYIAPAIHFSRILLPQYVAMVLFGISIFC